MRSEILNWDGEGKKSYIYDPRIKLIGNNNIKILRIECDGNGLREKEEIE